MPHSPGQRRRQIRDQAGSMRPTARWRKPAAAAIHASVRLTGLSVLLYPA